MSVTRDAYATAELKFIGKPVSTNNVRTFVIWMVSEGGNATWNPHNTTQDSKGATQYNSAGVKNYPDIQTGLTAFKETIENGRYGSILSALDRNAPPAETCNIIANSAWGSHPTPDLVASVLTSWDSYASVSIAGSESTPEPKPDPIPVNPPTEEDNPMLNDPEFWVRYLFRFCLHREADPDGFNTWVTFLRNGGSLNQLMADLQDSPEGKLVLEGALRNGV